MITKDNTEVLNIYYSDKIYKLNNSGVNIYDENEESQMILIISTDHSISKEIPIFIKLGIDSNKIQYINDKKKYEFNNSNYGVIKYTEDKKIKMKIKKISSDDVTFYYYNIYLYEDFLNDTSSIVSPVLFNNSRTIESKQYYFETQTELDPERYNNILNNYLKNSEDAEELYFIISFDGKVEIELTDGDSDDKSNAMIYIVIFCIILPLIIIIVILFLYFYFKKFRKKKKVDITSLNVNINENNTSFNENINENITPFNENFNENSKPFHENINENIKPFNEQYEKPTYEEEDEECGLITDENNLDNPKNNIEITKIPNYDTDTNNNNDPSLPAPLPYNHE